MDISLVTRGSYGLDRSESNHHSRLSRFKQDFEAIGTALASGDLTAAKTALEDLQSKAPTTKKSDKNPVAAKMEALSQAVESGDLEGAQKAYEEVKKTLSERPSGGRPPGGGGGPPPEAGTKGPSTKPSSPAEDDSDSGQTCDVKDFNRDGTVTALEEFQYAAKKPASTDTTASSPTTQSLGVLDLLA